MTAYKKSNSGFLPFIQKEKVTSPYTDIQNRAKIDASLKCIMGVERIHVNSLNLLTKEIGPNGELVYEPDNGDSRVRFVGSNWSSVFSTNGMAPQLAVGTVFPDTVEITFFGTGLNILSESGTGGVSSSYSLDGGIYTQFKSDISNILLNRNYSLNLVIPVISGLALDWHTIKIKKDNSIASLIIFGFEILNESSQITVKAGKAHGNGYEYELSSDQLIDYNLGFDNVLDVNVGTRGGRAVVYMDPTDGSIKKRLTKVDAASAFLGSADHTNEAVYRKVNFREFGRQRADDFSTITGANTTRGFTLDDGTTTLVGVNISASIQGSTDGLVLVNGNFCTITFVGTGLDIVHFTSAAFTNIDNHRYVVDGTIVGTVTGNDLGFSGTGVPKVVKVVSGLPYGTHTVKIERTTGVAAGLWFSDFIIYQPKKPSIPEGAVQICEYNLMADFVANATSGLERISTGVMRKQISQREATFAGTWAFPNPVTPSALINGWEAYGTSVGAYMEYTFYGTGFELRGRGNVAYSSNIIVSIDGVAGFDSYTSSAYGGYSIVNAITGQVSQNVSVNGSGLRVSGLTLGKHTIRFTANAINLSIEALDIITPINSPHTTFGSLSMKDIRNFDSNKDVNGIVKDKEMLAKVNRPGSLVSKSVGVSQVLAVGTATTYIYFEEPFIDNKAFAFAVSNVADKIVGLYDTGLYSDNSRIRIDTTNSSGAGENTQFTVTAKNKLQKDELEE